MVHGAATRATRSGRSQPVAASPQATNTNLISVGLVGYPNVGKSSIINTLKCAAVAPITEPGSCSSHSRNNEFVYNIPQ